MNERPVADLLKHWWQLCNCKRYSSAHFKCCYLQKITSPLIQKHVV